MDDVFQRFLRKSGPVLCLDIGSGTQDALLARAGVAVENWPRFVLPTPALGVAQRIRELTLLKRNVWLYGANMGGGFMPAVKSCLASGRSVYTTLSASKAINNSPQGASETGVQFSEDCPEGCVPVCLGDYAPQFWDSLLRSCGLPLPHLVLAAVQDHGDHGRSGNRKARMASFARLLKTNPSPLTWLSASPPPEMTRLASLRQATGGPVADTACAALLGALAEPQVMQRCFRQGVTIVNVGNGHVFAALVYKGLVRGIYEHHTDLRTRDELIDDLKEFKRFFLPAEKVLESGGHGTAYGAPCEDAGGFEPTYILGPRRAVLSGYGKLVAPYGSMMTAGPLGLLWGWAVMHGQPEPR